MGQNNAAFVAKNSANALVPLQVDAEGNLLTSSNDTLSHLDITAAVVVKATPGRLGKVIVNGVVGTGGALTINDCATTATAAASNEIMTIVGTTAVGTIINLDWPCLTGIVISAVPTGGTPQFAVSYT
jgi:hypothetical protein